MNVLTHSGSVAVLGLGFGDEGKGVTVDSLARKRGASLVIRFNGGSQAAHHVTAQEKVHCFSQFGSGTLAGARTYLSRFVVVDPLGLELEAEALSQSFRIREPLSLVSVDDAAPLVTPFHKLLGRAQELARSAGSGQRHGSCGKGIGVAWLDQQNGIPGVTWGQILGGKLRRSLKQVREEKLEKIRSPELWEHLDQPHLDFFGRISSKEYLDELLSRYYHIARETAYLEPYRGYPRSNTFPHPSKILFEGAQGTLLDADLGFYPFVTPSFTGTRNIRILVGELGMEMPLCIGVLRAYSSRHGAGPFVAEEETLSPYLPEEHNIANPWQAEMRTGWFDCVAAKYGIVVGNGVDGLMITHLDRMLAWPEIAVCEKWGAPTPPPNDFPSFTWDGNVLNELPLLKGSLEQRTRWSAWISSLFPIRRVLPGWISGGDPNLQSFLGLIREATSVPIVGKGFGPRAADQDWGS